MPLSSSSRRLGVVSVPDHGEPSGGAVELPGDAVLDVGKAQSWNAAGCVHSALGIGQRAVP
jgi:hypothetical protein